MASSFTDTVAADGNQDRECWLKVQAGTETQNVGWVMSSSDEGSDNTNWPESSVCDGKNRNCVEHVFDGDESTVWHCNHGAPCHLDFDLQSERQISTLHLTGIDNRFTSANLQHSSDGTSWTTLKSITISDNQADVDVDHSARYWKLDSISGNSGWPAIKEVSFESASATTGCTSFDAPAEFGFFEGDYTGDCRTASIALTDACAVDHVAADTDGNYIAGFVQGSHYKMCKFTAAGESVSNSGRYTDSGSAPGSAEELVSLYAGISSGNWNDGYHFLAGSAFSC